MSTNITLDNISLNYFKSSDIKVFPCVYRDPVYDKESKLNTERNFTKLGSSGFGSRISYIKKWENNTSGTGILYCNIGGYSIEINTNEYEQLLASDKLSYLILKLERASIATESSGSNTTYTYRIGTLDSEDSSTFIDHIKTDGTAETSYFTGLGYFTVDIGSDVSGLEIIAEDNPSTEYLYYLLQIGDNGSKAYNNFLPKINNTVKVDADGNRNIGINVEDLEIINSTGTASWLHNHVTFGAGVTGSASDKFRLGLQLANPSILEIPSFSSLSTNGYLPVKVFKDRSTNTTALGVNIIKERDINIKTNNADGTTSTNKFPSAQNINIEGIGSTKISLVDNNTIKIGSASLKPIYDAESGILVGQNLGADGVSDPTNDLYIPYATTSVAGVGKVYSTYPSEGTIITSNIGGRDYGIKLNPADKKLYVNVPWVDYTSQIAGLELKISQLESKINEGGEVQESPYTETPTVQILNSEGNIVDDEEYRITNVSEHQLKVYHNKKSSVSRVDVTLSSSKNYTQFILGRDATLYNLYDIIDINIPKDTIDWEVITVLFRYYDSYGFEIGNYGTTLTLNYDVPAPEVIPDYTSTPTIDIESSENYENATIVIQSNVNTAKGKTVSLSSADTYIIITDKSLNSKTIKFEEFRDYLVESPTGVYRLALTDIDKYIPYDNYTIKVFTGLFYEPAFSDDNPVVVINNSFSATHKQIPEKFWLSDPTWEIEDKFGNLCVSSSSEGVSKSSSTSEGAVYKYNINCDAASGFSPLVMSRLLVTPQTNVDAGISMDKCLLNLPELDHEEFLESVENSSMVVGFEGLGTFLSNQGVSTPDDGMGVEVRLTAQLIYNYRDEYRTVSSKYYYLTIVLNFNNPTDEQLTD